MDMKHKRTVAALVLLAAVAPAAASARNGIEAPSAAQSASLLAASTTAYARAHGIAARLENVDCVRASVVDYMCSYAVTAPNRPRVCHLMQATWTPNGASLYTTTLAGRVKVCDTLRDALSSLR